MSSAPPTTAGRRLDLRTARRAAALLREGPWQRVLLAVVALSVIFVFLGRWQWHRHEAKLARNGVVSADYSATPAPLAAVLTTTQTSLPADRQWQPVLVRGVYLSEKTVLVRNRPLDGDFGYEVIVPLRTPTGALFLVDRGWIPSGQTGAAPDTVPAPPAGSVEVDARLRPSEPGIDRAPPLGQQLRIDIPRIAAGLDAPTYRAYGVLDHEDPAPTTAPRLLPRPSSDLGPHLAYAVQWIAFALTAYVLVGVYAVREIRRRDGVRPVPRAARPPRPTASGRSRLPKVRARRQEMTDEDWEDLAVRTGQDT